MHTRAATLDDLLHAVLEKLVTRKRKITATRGSFVEDVGALLVLTNPRARLSRTERRAVLFSCLGELLWYLAGSRELDFVQYYIPKYKEESEDGHTIYGAYGPRLLGKPGPRQLENVVKILSAEPQSRRAVVQIFDAQDIARRRRRKEVPCTCTLQFLLRRGRLHMIATMRSNDAFKGLPHDVFAFTMLQEMVARELDAEPGTYTHFAASLHLYADDIGKAVQFMEEGYQPITAGMPPMPPGNPWPQVRKVLQAERLIRLGRSPAALIGQLDPYWADIVRLLEIFASKDNAHRIRQLRRAMSTTLYNRYIEGRQRKAERVEPGRLPVQEDLL